MKKTLYVLLGVVLLFVSCGKREMTAQQIFDEEKSGVVLIMNKYYYELTLPSGYQLFFSHIGEDGLQNLTDIRDSILRHQSVATGTGFFIDEEGRIVTNRHVTETEFTQSVLSKNYAEVAKILQSYLGQLIRRVMAEYDVLESRKVLLQGYDMFGNIVIHNERALEQITAAEKKILEEYNQLSRLVSQLGNSKFQKVMKIRVVKTLGIAYDGDKVRSESDFLRTNPAIVLATSKEEDADLSLIQLKSKQTPVNTHIFTFTDDPLEIDQELYMIGYNAGLILANTQKGISVQMTSGKVTQNPDSSRILYSIPTVQGSSGSPVLNKYGEVVGVNFAKLKASDNFNFAIPQSRKDAIGL